MPGLLTLRDFKGPVITVECKPCGQQGELDRKALVKQFLDSALTSRELLVSLIERVELTEEKEIIIKFRFHELEAIS